MGYEGHTLMIPDPAEKRSAIATAIAKLLEARDAVEAAGLQCRIISAGGSGSYQYTADIPGSPRSRLAVGFSPASITLRSATSQGHLPALTLLATVVSRPAPDRAILDIGQKSVSQYQTPPVFRDYPDCRVTGLSAEHATIALESGIGSAELEKKCTSFPVIAILLLCSTIAFWDFVSSGCRPRGTCWHAADCSSLAVRRRILLVDNHLGHGSGYSRRGSGNALHGCYYTNQES